MEKVDILLPPDFKKSGKVKPLKQAWEDGDWLGTFNLWVVQEKPVPAIIYQQRSPKISLEPGKLDVTGGGHYRAGEEIGDGLREVEEELGKKYKIKDLTYLGKRLYLGPDVKGRMRHCVVDVFMVLDNSPLESYQLQEDEVDAICACPIDKLIKVHTKKGYSFEVKGLTSKKKKIKIKVSKNSFPYNWDNYHFKIALLAERFARGREEFGLLEDVNLFDIVMLMEKKALIL